MTKIVGYLTNSLTGLQGERGLAYDYILTVDGLFLQAKNAHLAATICIAPQVVRGLAPLEESVQLLHGKIPLYLLNLALSVLCVKPDIEQYVAIAWRDKYTLVVPEQHSESAASVTYEPVPDTVLGLHSHGGGMKSFFSGVDDHDEQGFCLYAVAGELNKICPTVHLRLGVYGYFLELEKEDVFV